MSRVGRELSSPESWYLDLVDVDRDVAALFWLTMWPEAGRSWLWLAAAAFGDAPVVVIDDAAPLPSPPSLELRAPGVWADLVVEAADEHHSIGVEAFGVRLDEGAVPEVEPWGVRTALGFDLEWESDGRPSGPWGQRSSVHGELLIGDDAYAVDGSGVVRQSRGARWLPEPTPPSTGPGVELIVPLAGTMPDGSPLTVLASARVDAGWSIVPLSGSVEPRPRR